MDSKMSFLRRVVLRVAKELVQNPEARARASRIIEEKIKPRAKKAWVDAQPEINKAKRGLKDFSEKVREQYKKNVGDK